MIECSNCETSQFLQITESCGYLVENRIDGTVITSITERYECTLCGAAGGYTLDMDGTEQLTGDVTHKPTRPLTVEVS